MTLFPISPSFRAASIQACPVYSQEPPLQTSFISSLFHLRDYKANHRCLIQIIQTPPFVPLYSTKQKTEAQKGKVALIKNKQENISHLSSPPYKRFHLWAK